MRLENRAPYFLVNQIIALRAEAWECGTCATADDWFADVVATLGNNLVNIHFGSRIAQYVFLHNTFEIKLLNYSLYYNAGAASKSTQLPAEATVSSVALP